MLNAAVTIVDIARDIISYSSESSIMVVTITDDKKDTDSL
jgi:hypothetical protein